MVAGVRSFSGSAALPKDWEATQKKLQAMGSTDHHFEHERVSANTDRERQRVFQYSMIGGREFAAVVFARSALVKIVSSLSASADVLAMASIEVDLSKIAVGTTATVKWRGKPVFIRHRNDVEIQRARDVQLTELKHQQVRVPAKSLGALRQRVCRAGR